MPMWRPKAELMPPQGEQAQLQSVARSRSIPAALAAPARIVLACATGISSTSVHRHFKLFGL